MIFRTAMVGGVILLILLCAQDFTRRVIKPKQPFRYRAALLLFLVLNVFVYVAILRIVLGADPFGMLTGQVPVPENPVAWLGPLLMAVMYFGVGAAKISVGKFEVDLYDRMIRVFTDMFRMSFSKVDKIRRKLEESRARQEVIESTIARLHDVIDAGDQKKLEPMWEEVSDDCRLLRDHVGELETIHDRLSPESVGPKEIEEIRDEVGARLERLQQRIIRKLKAYLLILIRTSIRSEEAVEQILADLDVADFEASSPQRPNLQFRSFGFALPFGILLGLAASIAGPDGHEHVAYCWYGVFALSVFAVVFSLVSRTKKGLRDFVSSLFFGAAAGWLGFNAWELATRKQAFFSSYSDVFVTSIIGVEFGLVVALILTLAARCATRKPSKACKYAILCGFSALSFMVVGHLDHFIALDFGAFWTPLTIALAAVGIVVVSALAVAMNVFGGEEVLQ